MLVVIFFVVLVYVRPLLLAVNKVDLLPNSSHPHGKLGKEAAIKVSLEIHVVGRPIPHGVLPDISSGRVPEQSVKQMAHSPAHRYTSPYLRPGGNQHDGTFGDD